MLGKRAAVIENLDFIKRSYLKLVLLKERETEANEKGNYEFLYELSENERMLIEDINSCLKCIVPELVALRQDDAVRKRIIEIDRLHEAVISESLYIRNHLEQSLSATEKKLHNINVFPISPSSQLPHIVNIRA